MTFSWLNKTKLSPLLAQFYERLDEQCGIENKTRLTELFNDQPDLIAQLHFVLEHSEYVFESYLRQPNIIWETLDGNQINIAWHQEDYSKSLIEELNQVTESAKLDKVLRLFRNRSMCRIIWRDFNRLATMQDTTSELSFLAHACLQTSLDFHYKDLSKTYGKPLDARNNEQGMLILGMGKLGAYELNLSSDIDLIFCYPESGHTSNEDKSIDNQDFFSRLGKRIIQSLDAVTADGFVFRVDMRLRPFGESGPLVSNFASMEDYYQCQGREWERYAMIKARVVASNATTPTIDYLNQLLNQFSYRKYLDYSVIESLRNLKRMIVQEVKRRKLGDDVKLGAGGIRELEFVAQTFQLIRGGRDTELQDSRILHVIPLLEKLHCLPEGSAQKLIDAYVFLRNTEHAIQGYQDKQTQKLPVDEQQQLRLAKVMRHPSWESFYQELESHRQIIKHEFSQIIAEPGQEDTQDNIENNWQELWHNPPEQERWIAELKAEQHENPKRAFKILNELHQTARETRLHPISKQRLDQFIPLLLNKIKECELPSSTLARISKLIKAISRRSAYVLLLLENPSALEQLIQLSQASPWIADQLADQPSLLDELLNQQALYSPPTRTELEDELRRIMLRIPEDDIEEQMESLRYFRSSHALRVAASEITGILPLMKVSDYLTHIAEVILNQVLQLCWKQMTQKHGYPDGIESDLPHFAIVAYGKMGGWEMSHGSDLDLVFIHNASINGSTNGAVYKKREIDNQTFYMRLGQKIIHMLDTKTPSGQLYEVDMRLRPSGNSGLLVASLSSFEKYQQQSAWTWEHQALVRARVVAGAPALGDAFNEIRENILCQPRNVEKLKKDVIDMRIKMRDHLGSDKNNQGTHNFHIKQDPGGIVDIEFMVQYAVLAWSHTDPTLVTYTDNIRILENLARSELLQAQEAEQLTETYKTYRSFGHRLTLQQQPNLVEAELFSAERLTVTKIWARLFGSP